MNGRDEEMESEQDHQQPAGSQPRHGFNLKSVSDSWLDDASGLNSCDLRGHGVAAVLRVGQSTPNHRALERKTHGEKGVFF